MGGNLLASAVDEKTPRFSEFEELTVVTWESLGGPMREWAFIPPVGSWSSRIFSNTMIGEQDTY